jgi:hypothetical protein|tara:strand:+ start:1669 stop:2136 length:468 start_codon:yes stop_codon:yes gene_type:complete
MDQANMEQEPKVNKEVEEFLMTVVFQWLFKFKTAKTLNILMEVAFCQEVEKTLRLVLTKTIICTQLLGLRLKKHLILTLELTLIKLIRPKLVMNQLPALVTLKAENNQLGRARTEKTVVLISAHQVRHRAQPLQVQYQVNQPPVLTILSYRKEIN